MYIIGEVIYIIIEKGDCFLAIRYNNDMYIICEYVKQEYGMYHIGEP